MEQLVGAGGGWWRNLGLLLLIMRSDCEELSEHREWLRSNFFTYMCIVFSTYPAKWVVSQLYNCIDNLMKERFLGADPLFYWPSSLDEMHKELECYRYVFDRLIAQKWWSRRKGGEDPWLFIWLLCEERKMMQDLCDDCDLNYKVPDKMRVKWRRAAVAARASCVEFRVEGVSMRELSASDRRIISRLNQEADW
ncbi:hypothetical protein ACNFBT_11740 [Pseudomonas sp. NY15181]|uniref:hypothetical protein n=1 Tax=Pseudomonas sp. NY15181 TaxID=3400349 RepID=UPI003A86B32C